MIHGTNSAYISPTYHQNQKLNGRLIFHYLIRRYNFLIYSYLITKQISIIISRLRFTNKIIAFVQESLAQFRFSMKNHRHLLHFTNITKLISLLI
jgi:hypothetical protein